MQFRVLKSNLKKEKNNVYQLLLFNVAMKDVSSYLFLRRTLGVGLGQSWGKTKGRKPGRVLWFYFFNFLLLLFFWFWFFLDWGKGVTQKGGKEENYNPWFRLSSAGKDIFLVSPHAKKEKNQPTWKYAQTPTMLTAIRISLRGQHSQHGHTRLVGLLVEPTSQKSSFPKASSFLLVGYKNRTSAVNRRVLNTFNHWQGFRKFHSFVMLYFITIIFTFLLLFIYFLLNCWFSFFNRI